MTLDGCWGQLQLFGRRLRCFHWLILAGRDDVCLSLRHYSRREHAVAHSVAVKFAVPIGQNFAVWQPR